MALLLAFIIGCFSHTFIWAQTYLYDRAGFPSGQGPSAVIMADFNGDGRLDMAIANEADNTVSILLGLPGGTFASQTVYAAGSSPTGIVAADFNGDGKLDLAVMDSCGSCTVSPNTVTILLGNGDGTFRNSGNYATGNGPIGITAADFNGDGKMDLALANEEDNTVSILLGNGDGTFQPQSIVAVGTRPYWFASGDFDGDGKIDLATLNIGAGTVSVLLSNGNGTFTRVDSPSGPPPGPSLGALTAGDFNGDGKLDVVVASNGSQLYLLLGNGDGSLQSPTIIPSSAVEESTLVMAADFNHDGKLDLAQESAGGTVMVLLGNGDGTFQNPLASPVGETASETADVNGDGALDLIATDSNLNTADIILGNGNGTFGLAGTVALAGTNYFPDAGVVADFNGDGKLDLAVAETGSPNGQISVQLGNGDGTFQSPIISPLTIEGTSNDDLMVESDFNGDGKPDLLIMDDYAAGFEVLLGNGDGSFQTAVNTPVSPTILSMAVGDFNLDGKPDVVTTTNGGSPLNPVANIYLGNGDGTFHAGAQYSVPAYASVTVSDVNDDGKPDLVVASFGEPLEVFLGNGDGTFQNPISGPVAIYSGGMVIEDFNGDRKPDITVGTYSGIAFLAGNGDGTFESPVYSACGLTTCSTSGIGYGYSGRMVSGDFDGDGKPDLATYPPFDTGLSGAVVLIGNGDGTFQNPIPFSATGTPVDLLAGDFNSDGIGDLAMPNQAIYSTGASVVTLYLSGPTLDFYPGSLTFGMQNVGNGSSPLQVTLTNLGPGNLKLSDIQITGDFSETNDCGTGLTKGQDCNISVTFQPTINGLRSGSLSVTDNAAASPQLLALSGTGVTRTASFSPTTLTFTNQFAGTSAASQTITLSNTGNAALTTSEISITGSNASSFSQTNNCGTALSVEASCGINVVFTPGATGTQNAMVIVADNAIGSPQSIPVSGVGIGFGLAASSAGSTSSVVTAGTTATYDLVIGGAGFAGSVALTCTGVPKGANCSGPSSLSLSATSTQTLSVTVSTTSATSASLVLGKPLFWATLVFGLLVLPPTKKRRLLSRGLVALSLPLLLGAICSCGGGSSGASTQSNPNATPSGTYILTLTAAAGSNTQTLALTLTVQ